MPRTEKVRSQYRLRTETKPGKDGGTGEPPAGGSPGVPPRHRRLPYRTISIPAGASISTTVSPFSLRKAQTDSAPFGVG